MYGSFLTGPLREANPGGKEGVLDGIDGIDQIDQTDKRPPHLNPLPPGERKIRDEVVHSGLLRHWHSSQ